MKQTRVEWERTHHSNEPFPPWSLSTWKERAVKTVVVVFMTAVFIGGAALLIAGIGETIDVAAQRSEQHSRCLKDATNGLEIEMCR